MIDNFRRVFGRLLEVIVLALVALLATVVILGVFARKLGAPLIWYDELASILLAWLTYYGACFAALHRAHIGFPTIVDSAGPRLARALLLLREFIVIAFFVLAAWTGWMVMVAVEGFYLASIPWLSRQLTHSVIPIGAVLFIIAELLSLHERWGEAKTSAEGESKP